MNAREAFLEGGPAGTPERYSIPEDDPVRLRVPRLNGYEHYEFNGTYRTVNADRLPVYRWIYTTHIAE
ncbi:DUF5988 family protein [Streptomyces sp. NPDC008265]|uniref:DUF5988 family protein n=1 Tax=Streptomyces sp. NPDC008265 TaxID=3364824 RepID=UPI0036E9D29A